MLQERDTLEILHKLYLIRDLEERIAEHYPQGKMRCPVHLSIGQEGVPAALAPLLRHDDLAVSTHRSHAHYLAKGGSPRAMLAEIMGRVGGCSGARGGSMHLIDESVGFKGSTAIVGNTIPIGVGLGLAIKLRGKRDRIAVVFLGDGSTEEGAFYESVTFAAVQNLPVLFVCENNFYSVYAGLEPRQPAGRSIHQMAAAMGLRVAAGDGNDIPATYQTLTQSIDSVRQGNGPMLVEFTTYRWREHCGPFYDNDIGYRTEAEYLEWRQRDPLEHFERYLLASGQWSRDRLDNLRQDVGREIDQAFTWAETQPYPHPDQAFTAVYREMLA